MWSHMVQEGNDVITKLFPAFGTMNSITLFDACDASILEEIKQRSLQMHSRFSFFRPESELSQINQQAGVCPVPIHRDTFTLLSLAVGYAKDTKGTFDVTAGAISELWKTPSALPRCPQNRMWSTAGSVAGLNIWSWIAFTGPLF